MCNKYLRTLTLQRALDLGSGQDELHLPAFHALFQDFGEALGIPKEVPKHVHAWARYSFQTMPCHVIIAAHTATYALDI